MRSLGAEVCCYLDSRAWLCAVPRAVSAKVYQMGVVGGRCGGSSDVLGLLQREVLQQLWMVMVKGKGAEQMAEICGGFDMLPLQRRSLQN